MKRGFTKLEAPDWYDAYDKWGEGNWGCGDKATIQQEAFGAGWDARGRIAEARITELEQALTRIAATRYGLEPSKTTEEALEYWSELALAYRHIAYEVLTKKEKP